MKTKNKNYNLVNFDKYPTPEGISPSILFSAKKLNSR